MPSPATVAAFIALVESNDHVAAIEQYYAPDASMRENGDEPRRGRDGLVARERAFLGMWARIDSRRLGPVLIDGDHVAIHWRFEFTPAEGPSRVMEEIAWQRWEGDRVVEERFFYNPAQMAG